MSLVNVIIEDEFIIVCGDKRVIDKNGNILSEKANKVVKLNDNIIIGLTGSLKDCYEFIDDYCTFTTENGFCKKACNISFIKIINALCKKYQEICIIHNDEKIEKEYNFGIIVAGYDGQKFVNYSFYLHSNSENIKGDGVFRDYKKTDKPFYTTLGSENATVFHFNKLKKDIETQIPMNIAQYEDILKDVYNKGIIIDGSINNDCQIEVIRKVDVL